MGKVYLVGAGPGAPDLLTLRAARLVEAADVVLHDALVHPEVLALSRGRLIDVGKRYGKVSTEQRFINRALVEAARTHAVVVRLKGGDPMIFGRGGEEAEEIAAAGIPFEIVPGISAALGAAAATGIPLTHREAASSVAYSAGLPDPTSAPRPTCTSPHPAHCSAPSRWRCCSCRRRRRAGPHLPSATCCTSRAPGRATTSSTAV
jgi:uroporphyrin-III C-methyltransferase